MPSPANTPAQSFDDHVADVLALVADRRPALSPRVSPRPRHIGRPHLTLVPPLSGRAADDREAHR
ncbi:MULTISPECIES: hypothetical protein [Streptomyces]|uniref:Uncharacterized protein n=1 Tax=Streptomyces kaniharaensis TaxID=212423 RepID=A0A6N7L0Q2_9ACTN|nr:hypothetical protein [Streptomyces kaniharaensis]MQS17211.1 hypothetical protein [Streptomyces kaniharaensis]